jgi:UDP-N-acetylglucosamine--N-acetylmuramyl-(pentapeptide) pyrophosphoryl-undecaprenol N-acetylglucosamine transferase
MGIPLMLQEQNSFPGVTNRILSKKAKHIFTAFPDATSYFPSRKVQLLGNPVRADISNGDRKVAAKDFGLNPEAKTLLVMGGSGGAKAINDAMVENLENLHDGQQLQIIWQCGKRYFGDLQKRIDVTKFPNLRLVAFLENMPNAYAMSDLVVCRAGAGTIAELSVLGLPTVLVPSPWVAGDHQTKNAQSFVQAGAATLLKDDELSEKLSQTVSDLITSPEKLSSMRKAGLAMALPNAAQNIAKAILESTQIQTEVPVS